MSAEHPKRRRILVVDDDPELRMLLEKYLGRYDFEIATLPDAADVERRLARFRPDVLVLDLMLPGEDGLSVCKRLRGRGETVPIIMLTARDEPFDRVLGLELGADEYIGKPFEPRELVARIDALLRRARLPVAAPDISENVRVGDWIFDRASRELLRGQERVSLTSGEFALLKALTDHPLEPLRRDQLLALARDSAQELSDRAIDVQVSRLRKYLEQDPRAPRYIQTVWGVGYVFVPASRAIS
ncbi:MAG: response regulator [Gammaproteobacteria bacterium]|jgi:DNA-binding response OmpR family regulator|nr:response regulator [Gammaproteobacteria bacterium]NBX40741.1 response regulator [Gammaproteobacteria bacterium]